MKEKVNCSWCNSELFRNTWNYNKKCKREIFFCDYVCKGNWQRSQKELLGYTKEWLIDEYHNKEKTANDIAREIGKDPKSVWLWLKGYGIETRPRGSNLPPITPFGEDNPFYGKHHTEETREKIRQARFEDGGVPYLKDGIHWMKHEDYTQENNPSWKGGITPERQAIYSSLEWKELVKKVWQRDNATCQRCGKYFNDNREENTFHIHHIVSFMVEELRLEFSNLLLVCDKCHYWIHSKKNKNKEFIKEIQ